MGQQDQKNHQSGLPIEVDLAQDLAWLLQSQPLMANQQATPFKLTLSNCPEHHCTTYPAQPAYRLGKHFEDCVDLFFAGSNQHQVLGRNIVITATRQTAQKKVQQTVQQTIGELDLLYRNAAQQIIHLEIAIKFYLLEKQGTTLSNFIGPAGHDRLDLKWERLLNHQLPMSQRPETTQFLNQHQLPLPEARELLLTGMLFYAYENWQHTQVSNIGLNPEHQRGWWLEHHELDQLSGLSKDDQLTGYVILPKWHWIGGHRHYSNPQPISYGAMKASVSADVWPNMVVIYTRQSLSHTWQPVSRGLILATKKPPLVS